MPKMKNPRCEAFALAAASGAPLSDAYEDAGFRGGPASAVRLARRADIRSRVDELRRDQADLDEARPTAVIVALVRMARQAERLETVAGIREARLTLLQAQRMHQAQTKAREDARLTLLDDEEWDAIFQSLDVRTNADDGIAGATASPATRQ